MRKIAELNWKALMAMVSAMILFAAGMPFLARAQTKHANDTLMLISRDDGGSVNMHAEGRGDHCWASTSDDRGVGISMGDERCTLWDESDDDSGLLRAKVTPSEISFRLDGKAYVITDAAMVRRARVLFDPLVTIGDKQSALGEQQRTLGAKQREFGRLQREAKVQVPDMGADIQKVEADGRRLSAQGGTQSELGDLQSEIGDLQSRLGDLQSQASDMQSKFGDQQSKLGDQQSALGDQQSALGDQSEKIAADVAAKLRAMLAQAIQSGAAVKAVTSD